VSRVIGINFRDNSSNISWVIQGQQSSSPGESHPQALSDPDVNLSPLSRKTAWVAIRTYGEKASLAVPAHPHMLRHACGFALADQGADTRLIQDYLGHRNIQHTVMYTATNPARFEKLWR